MKTIAAVLLTLMSYQANAQVLVCQQLEIYQQDDRGNESYQASDLTVEIVASTAGPYGFQATIASGGQIQTENDVNVSTVPPKSGQIKEMVDLMLPQVKWDDVHSVRVGNVGVRANQQDAAGIMIFELLDQAGGRLGKVATLGWSFGRCGI